MYYLISLKTYLCNCLTTDGLTSCWLILVLEGLRYEDDMYPWFDDTEYPPGDVTLWLRGEWLYLEDAYNGEATFCRILPILGLPCWAFSWSSFSFACNGIEKFISCNISKAISSIHTNFLKAILQSVFDDNQHTVRYVKRINSFGTGYSISHLFLPAVVKQMTLWELDHV